MKISGNIDNNPRKCSFTPGDVSAGTLIFQRSKPSGLLVKLTVLCNLVFLPSYAPHYGRKPRYVRTWQRECDTFGRPTVIVLLFKCEWNMAVNTCLDSNSCSPGRLDREMNRWTADGASANHRARLRRHPTPDWSVAARAPAFNDSLRRWRSFSLFTVSVVYHTRSGFPPDQHLDFRANGKSFFWHANALRSAARLLSFTRYKSASSLIWQPSSTAAPASLAC